MSVVAKNTFKILIFLLPTQLALHFWPEWAHTFGIRVDYLSPTLYLTDVVLVLLFYAYFFGQSTRARFFRDLHSKRHIVFLVGLFALLNVFVAGVWQVAFLKWVRVAELSLFVYILRREQAWIIRSYAKPLSLAVIFTSLLAISQLFFQRTVGGALYYFGERTFTSGTPGIALFDLQGRSFMRPYGTFGHPNALAGFLLVSIILIFDRAGSKTIFKTAIFFGLVTVVISFSQTAWFVAIVLLAVYLANKRQVFSKSLAVKVFVTMVVVSLLLLFARCSGLVCNAFPPEVVARLDLNTVAGALFSTSPLLGVGFGNFIPTSTTLVDTQWFLQPVHNVFLLVLAELGVAGLLGFYYLVTQTLHALAATSRRRLIFSMLAILLTGMTDHYWLTQHQNQLLFALVLGISLKGNVKKKNNDLL